MKQEDFFRYHYELRLGESSLEFIGEKGNFLIPYMQICDFCITIDNRNRKYFIILCEKQMYEGKILEGSDVKIFLETLKIKICGVIHVNVRKD